MKKFILALSIIYIVSVPAFAAITPQESKSEEYIINHGHSEEMSRLIDLQNVQINKAEPTYVKPKEHWRTLKYPRWCTESRVKWIRDFFIYIDPSLDDDQFMKHNIDYSNKYDDL